MKQRFIGADGHKEDPAAFRRLCVETWVYENQAIKLNPAAFRRLCVETMSLKKVSDSALQPPSGGCVLKRR